ncbi:MAG: tetratricopeptide repeat protein, partial [Verrucomicrobiia bacterium]
GIYFGNKDEALREGKLDLGYYHDSDSVAIGKSSPSDTVPGTDVRADAADNQSQQPWSLDQSPVSAQLKHFVAEKEAQVNAVAVGEGKELPPEFKELFAAAAKGDWQTVTNLLGWGQRAAFSNNVTESKRLHGSGWAPAMEVSGAFEQFVAEGDKYSIAFGQEIIKSIPPGSIYFGGTDPGRFLVTALSKSHVNADPFFTLTQNGLADKTYLGYLHSMYGRRIDLPTEQDTQRCFQEYVDDVRTRNQENKLKPDEHVTVDSNGRVSVTGVAAVMGINARMVRLIFDRNPDREFYIEESYPLDWTYPYLEPHGLILKLNRKPLTQLDPAVVAQDREYWDGLTKQLLADPKFLGNKWVRNHYSKLRSAIGGVYAYRKMTDEAEYVFKQALALCPDSPEANFRLARLYGEQKRFDDGITLLRSWQQRDPSNQKIQDAINQLENERQSKQAEQSHQALAEPDRLDLGYDQTRSNATASAFQYGPASERNPAVVVAETIRSGVGRQLREARATYDDLQVTVAEQRDSGTPFVVSYKGLRNFNFTYGGQRDPKWPSRADGHFIMQYIGGGQWQGALGDTQFTVTVGRTDNIDLPFVNDPQVIGEWESVDFVTNPSDFNPDELRWKGELYLKGLTFLENGRTTQAWWTWTKGILIHRDDKTASDYRIQEVKGQLYMFLEWKSGDVMILGMKPQYYVLRKKPVNDAPPPAARKALATNHPAGPLADLDAKIVQLSRPGTTIKDVIRMLGEPGKYLWGDEQTGKPYVFTKNNLPEVYIAQYPHGVRVLVRNGKVVEFRSEDPGPGFSWRGNLHLGSSLDDVLQVLGPPTETVVGKPLAFAANVLYKDIDGANGYCYYSRPEQNVRLFFRNYKVVALYITLEGGHL